eukprot:55491-Eustigmatos_ZCMA.PRE.1
MHAAWSDIRLLSLECVSPTDDRTVRLWDVRGGKSGQETHKIPTPGENINIAWSPCGTYIAVGNDKDQVREDM